MFPMSPLIWLLSGIALMIVEVATPGFVIGFFGLAAITVAALTKLIPMSQGWQWLAFSVLTILYIVALRKWLKSIFVGEKNKSVGNPDDSSIGQIVKVTEDIKKNIGGRVDLFGASWMAVAETDIPKGATVRVIGKENLTVKVEEVK